MWKALEQGACHAWRRGLRRADSERPHTRVQRYLGDALRERALSWTARRRFAATLRAPTHLHTILKVARPQASVDTRTPWASVSSTWLGSPTIRKWWGSFGRVADGLRVRRPGDEARHEMIPLPNRTANAAA